MTSESHLIINEIANIERKDDDMMQVLECLLMFRMEQFPDYFQLVDEDDHQEP